MRGGDFLLSGSSGCAELLLSSAVFGSLGSGGRVHAGVLGVLQVVGWSAVTGSETDGVWFRLDREMWRRVQENTEALK